MINVVFKDNCSATYGNKRYTYKSYEGAEIGDIVAVNTINGLALAKVVDVNVDFYAYDLSTLKSVFKVVKSRSEIKAEFEKRQKTYELAQELKRMNILNSLKSISTSKKLDEELDNLSLEELENLVSKISD